MSVDLLIECACSSLALNELITKGCNRPTQTFGKLGIDTGATVQIGDWVKYDTSTNTWLRVATSDDLANYIVGVVSCIKNGETGEVLNSVSVDTTAFFGAILWTSGGDPIKASCTYVYNSGTRTAFAPETHTSLASKVSLIPFTGHDGSTETYYFTLK